MLHFIWDWNQKPFLEIQVSSHAAHGILSLYTTGSVFLVADKSESPVGSYCGTFAPVQADSIPGTAVHMRIKNHSKMRTGRDLWMLSGSDSCSEWDQTLQDLVESKF